VSRSDIRRQHDHFLHELSEERAAALLRISRTLESAIEQLRLARERIPRLGGADRAREVAAYRALREHAIRYRWYLEVQREALGMRHHHMLDEFYRIPAAIEE
jgi:erythromycin esterase-like protein